jgi:hypothetical protein
MKKLLAFGCINQGALHFFNGAAFTEQLREIWKVNHFRLVLEYGNKRTVDQNAYLWGAVIKSITVLYRQYGWDYSEDEVYKILENAFCRFEMVNFKTGETQTKIKPFKTLTTDEWDEVVMGRIREWCQAELGTYIQTPAQFYEVTESNYDAWKAGEISLDTARRLSKQRNPVKLQRTHRR